MKLSKLFSTILLSFLVVAVSVPAFASKAQELVQRADGYLEKVKATKSSSAKRDYIDKATDAYNKAIKLDGDSVEAAQAYYGLGQVQELTPPKGNDRGAYDAYKQVINRYGKSTSDLEAKYAKDEIEEIKAIARQATKREDVLREKLNKENSKQWTYKIVDFLVKATGSKKAFSYWFAIVFLTIVVKLITAPLTKKQFTSMKEMQRVAPLIKQVQEKYKGDPKTISEKQMALYKEHNISPFASCLPILIQMPILWFLYAMVRAYEFELANGTFLWIGAVKHPIGIGVPAFFGQGGATIWLTAQNLAQPDLILVVLYLVSMYISTKMSTVDPTQADQQKIMAIMMPVMFAFIFASFPSAFLLYWLGLNIIQTVQQYRILKQTPEEIAAAAAAANVLPADSSSDQRVRRPRRRR